MATSQKKLDIKAEKLNTAMSKEKSSIRKIYNTDMACEKLNAMEGTILQNIAISMLAKLNMAPQQVLQLFGYRLTFPKFSKKPFLIKGFFFPISNTANNK